MQIGSGNSLSRSVMGFAIAGVLTAAAAAQTVDVLKTAHEVGKELDGWKYGTEAKEKQINDVQFTLRVVEKLEPKLSDDVKKHILMSDLTAQQTAADKDGVVSKRDKRTHGVAAALVDAGLAHEVKLEDAKPGDFIQYWMKSKGKDDEKAKDDSKGKDAGKSGDKSKDKGAKAGDEGEWAGHAGVIEKVEKNKKGELKAFVYSSHKFTNGVGVAPSLGVRLVDEEDRRIYVARWGKPAASKTDKPKDKPAK